MKNKLLLAVTIAICFSLLFTALILLSKQPTTPHIPIASEESEIVDTRQTEYEFIADRDSQVALELLEENADVETQNFGDAGAFVTSINGLVGNSKNYWAFYLNGEYAQQGASQTILQEGDVIKFVYEAIEVY